MSGAHRERLVLAAIVAVALAVRLAHFWALAGTAYPELPRVFTDSDMHATLRWAEQILAGDVLGRDPYHPHNTWMRSIAPLETWHRWWGGKEVFQQAPLYTYWVAVWLGASGGSLALVLLVQLLLGATQPLVLHALARRFAGPVAGLAAAALAAVHGPLVFHQGTLLRDWLPPLLEPLGVLLVLRAADRDRGRSWAAAGAVLGLAFLVKETALGALVVLVGWAAWTRWRAGLPAVARSAGLFAAGFLVAVAPLGVRNALVGAPLLAVSNRAAEGIVVANAADAIPVITHFNEATVKRVMERSDGRLPGVVLETLRTYEGDWRRLLALQWLKARGLVDPLEAPNNLALSYAADLSPVLRWLPGHGLVFPLGIAGLLWTLGRWRPLLPWLLYTASTIAGLLLAGTLGRYRLAVVPPLIVFAGMLVALAWESARARRGLRLATLLATVGALVVVQQWLAPLALPRERFAVVVHGAEYDLAAKIYAARGRYDLAAAEIERLRQRVAALPRFAQAMPGIELLAGDYQTASALQLARAGRPGEARQALARAESAYGRHGDVAHVQFNLGLARLALGEPGPARTHLERFLALEPEGPNAAQARRLLGRIDEPGATSR